MALAGGGTGGHVYPLLAVAEAAPDWEIHYVGTPDGLEAGIIRREGIPFHALPAGGLRGKRLLPRILGGLRIAAGTLQALGLLRRMRPDAVLSSGGYAAVPISLAAVALRVPLLVLEPNASPGLANRLMLGTADRILLGFEAARSALPHRAARRAETTGVPVRQTLLQGDRTGARRTFGIPDDAVVVAVFGGSRGATALNEAARRLAATLAPPAFLLWATGERDWPAFSAVPGDRLRIEPYFWDMPSVYAAADVVVSRAGALTCAEITAVGLPSVLVPSPNVVADHQTDNARMLSAAGAARLIPEAELERGALEMAMAALVSDAGLRGRMGGAARAMGRPDAARRVARAVEKVVLQRRAGITQGRSAGGR